MLYSPPEFIDEWREVLMSFHVALEPVEDGWIVAPSALHYQGVFLGVSLKLKQWQLSRKPVDEFIELL
jgi:hypothetical protein